MATYYVGPGGNNANTGLSWAQRKLTLNGAEDIPVVADDLVYVGPGTYREQWDIDVSGGAGTEIVFVGDVTGEHTDGVGGPVRITGSDDDESTTRNYCIYLDGNDYRIFRGFTIDMATQYGMNFTDGEHITVEDCFFQSNLDAHINVDGADQHAFTARRCFFCGGEYVGIIFYHNADVDDAGHVVENCVFIGMAGGINGQNIGGILVANCSFVFNGWAAVDTSMEALDPGQTVEVYNCIIYSSYGNALVAAEAGDIIEDYNSFWENVVDRTSVAVGANSVTMPPLWVPPILLSGFHLPWEFPVLSWFSPLRQLAGSSMPADDRWGMTRPVTDSKKSWGAGQWEPTVRDTTTRHTPAGTSFQLTDAGRRQFIVPTTNVATTFSVWVYRETNYAGNLPQLIVKQAGQADGSATAAGPVNAWEQLTVSLTPAAKPDYCIIELVSRNTGGAGSYSVFFDDLVVA